jgi:Family of unknown function (DUF6518)
VPVISAAVALAGGVALGVAARASNYGGGDLTLLFVLGAPWLVVAFGAGASARTPAVGALAGAVALTVAVAVYYALMLRVEGRASPHYALGMTVLWGAAGAAVGALFGAAGATLRKGSLSRAVGFTVLGGALAGEAAFFLARRGIEAPGGAVLAGELVAGVLLVLVAAWPRRSRVLALGATVAVAAGVDDGALRALMRTKGWGG